MWNFKALLISNRDSLRTHAPMQSRAPFHYSSPSFPWRVSRAPQQGVLLIPSRSVQRTDCSKLKRRSRSSKTLFRRRQYADDMQAWPCLTLKVLKFSNDRLANAKPQSVCIELITPSNPILILQRNLPPQQRTLPKMPLLFADVMAFVTTSIQTCHDADMFGG